MNMEIKLTKQETIEALRCHRVGCGNCKLLSSELCSNCVAVLCAHAEYYLQEVNYNGL